MVTQINSYSICANVLFMLISLKKKEILHLLCVMVLIICVFTAKLTELTLRKKQPFKQSVVLTTDTNTQLAACV